MKEIWKPVRGFEEYAEISNMGQIHYYAGKSKRFPDERWTYGCDNGKGYLYACIGYANKGVHVWVYMTFNDCDIPKGLQVNHIDEDKHNNRLDNLNLKTPKDNSNWGTRNAKVATSKRGKKRPAEVVAKVAAAHRGKYNTKISKAVQTLDKVTGEVIMEFPSAAEAQRQGFGDHRLISACCLGKRKSYKGYIWRFKENKSV